jgi:hypothetical protein
VSARSQPPSPPAHEPTSRTTPAAGACGPGCTRSG